MVNLSVIKSVINVLHVPYYSCDLDVTVRDVHRFTCHLAPSSVVNKLTQAPGPLHSAIYWETSELRTIWWGNVELNSRWCQSVTTACPVWPGIHCSRQPIWMRDVWWWNTSCLRINTQIQMFRACLNTGQLFAINSVLKKVSLPQFGTKKFLSLNWRLP